MSKWNEAFEKARNQAGKEIADKAGSNVPAYNKAKKAVETTQKTVKNAKIVAKGIGGIFSAILNGLLFLLTTPVGWTIDFLIVLVIGIIILGDTFGQNSFNSSCPATFETGQVYTGKKSKTEKDKDSEEESDCKVFGDGKGKGRTSGGSGSGNNAGGTGEWAKNGTGSIPGVSGWKGWLPNDLPEEVKKYALNPESVNMTFGSRTGWEVIAWSGGQCTDLAASLMYAIWEKNGEHPRQAQGNGYQVSRNWAAKFGGEVTTTPTAGAVFSSSTTSPGHTGVVSHVFENGDFLTVEQNITGYCGDNAGKPHTWMYVYHSKSEIASDSYTFFDPSTVGFKLVSEAVSH